MGVTDKVSYAAGMLKKYGGAKGLITKVKETRNDTITKEYEETWQLHMASEKELEKQRQTEFDDMPLISIVVPTYETPDGYLRALIHSLEIQTYPNWELCIADGSSSMAVSKVLMDYQDAPIAIRHEKLDRNMGIAANTNHAIAMARGDYIGLLDHDDMLTPNALFEMVKLINKHDDADVIYSDEDKVDEHGEHPTRPHFKLDFNKEMLLHQNYICHFLVIRSSLLRKIGGFREGYDGSQDYDLLLRLLDRTDKFYHIEKVLYHWRVHSESTAGSSMSKNYAYEAGQRALQDYVDRHDIFATIQETPGQAWYQWAFDDHEDFAVVDWAEMNTLHRLMYTILSTKEDYVFVWNSKKVGEIPDAEKQHMVDLCAQRKVGIVGCRIAEGKLLKCAGLGRKRDGSYKTLQKKVPVNYQGYFNRAVMPQNVAAVYLDCCVIRMDALKEVAKLTAEKVLFLDQPKTITRFCEHMEKAGYEVLMDGQVTAKVVK